MEKTFETIVAEFTAAIALAWHNFNIAPDYQMQDAHRAYQTIQQRRSQFLTREVCKGNTAARSMPATLNPGRDF
jgi:hypothetical protein